MAIQSCKSVVDAVQSNLSDPTCRCDRKTLSFWWEDVSWELVALTHIKLGGLDHASTSLVLYIKKWGEL